MKSLIMLLSCVLADCGTRCHTSTTLDLKTVKSRIKHEGLSFLTITLSNFGKDFEKSLDQSATDPTLFAGFQLKGGLPLFLGGFLDLVFDRGTGRLLDIPSIDAISSIRQLTLMWSKIGIECTEKRTRAAINKYIQCEKEVKDNDAYRSESDDSDYRRIARVLYSGLLSSVDLLVYRGETRGKHGPGATADHLSGNGKYDNRTWTRRLDTYFPYGEYVLPSWRYHQQMECVNFLEPGAEIPVRVITVPKTLKTPRIIAIEPTHMQFVQQGLLEAIVSSIEKDDISSWLINFSSQIPNQQLARIGSVGLKLATLDLSEASDRVSNQLVRGLLANHPHLAAGVDACRSRKADVPGHGVIRLAKFASMGSALCFPFESMVFSIIVFLGIERVLNRHLSRSDVKSFRGQVRIYGDDIIVPVRFVSSVIGVLEDFGFRVNTNKSFWTGKFRESCGKDYYDGHDVTVTKVRTMIPTKRKHVPEIVSTVSLRNQLFLRDYVTAVAYLDTLLEGLIPFPVVESTSSILGRLAHSPYVVEKWDRQLQRPLVRGVVVKADLPRSHLEGHAALMKFFLKRGDLPVFDRNHLERAGRPRFVDIKTRWGQPF